MSSCTDQVGLRGITSSLSVSASLLSLAGADELLENKLLEMRHGLDGRERAGVRRRRARMEGRGQVVCRVAFFALQPPP